MLLLNLLGIATCISTRRYNIFLKKGDCPLFCLIYLEYKPEDIKFFKDILMV